jgi:hypothetical protein
VPSAWFGIDFYIRTMKLVREEENEGCFPNSTAPLCPLANTCKRTAFSQEGSLQILLAQPGGRAQKNLQIPCGRF